MIVEFVDVPYKWTVSFEVELKFYYHVTLWRRLFPHTHEEIVEQILLAGGNSVRMQDSKKMQGRAVGMNHPVCVFSSLNFLPV